MKIYKDYYKAKQYAQEHNLIECEYYDTSYYENGQPISYVAYNRSGDPQDDWKLVCYYTWQKIDGCLKPKTCNMTIKEMQYKLI